MEGTHPYALFVELEENNIQKLRNKLVKYFQSNKKSNGGDCEVEHENGSRTAVLRFRREEDQQNVLAKESHQINSDNVVLKMTVRLLSDSTTTRARAHQEKSPESLKDTYSAIKNKQSGTTEPTPEVEVPTTAGARHDDAEGEELCSTSAVLGNIPETLNQEFLEMLVENIFKDIDSPSAAKSFTVELIPGTSSAVVTFQSGKEAMDFVTRCPQNRTFTNKGLSVQALDLTEQIVVEDLQHFRKDYLHLYFENAGGEVEDVVVNEVEQSAVIIFKDYKAVQKTMEKKHHIEEKEIRVYPFYKTLGTALYGKDGPSLKLPAAISEHIDNAVWRYLNDNQSAAQMIHDRLAKHFCNVDLSQPAVCLRPVSGVLQQKDAKVIVKEWKNTVKSAFAQAVSKFKSLLLQPESDAWVESEEKLRQILLNESVDVVPDKANGVLSVVGIEADVTRLEKTIREAVNKIVKMVQRKKLSVTKEMKVSPSIFHVLCQSGLQDKLRGVFPELEMLLKKDGLDLTGLPDEIAAAKEVIYDGMVALKRQNLETDKFVLELLKDEQQEDLTHVLLTSHGINAAFEINGPRVQLLAVSDQDLNDAQDYLGKLLISQYINVKDGNVLKKPNWELLVSQLEGANNKACKRIRIQTSGQQVVVSGNKDDVARVSRVLDTFLTQNEHVEETVVVRPDAIVGYIQKLDGNSWLGNSIGKVVVSYRKEAICLSGSRVDVTECKATVEDLASSVFFDSLKITVPGVKKFFKDQEVMYVNSVLNKTGCLVQLVDETKGSPDLATKPVYQVVTSDGVEIAVCKADMCSYPVHAVVNPSNQSLKHDGGLSKALLDAAGPQLQDECDKRITSSGLLKPGDCEITGAGGRLCCKKVIHAVGPQFDQSKSQKSHAQLKKAVKGSLELAEKHGCVSVALPTISRTLGFPLHLCADTIVRAVREHCDEKYDDNPLKKIHFVDSDSSAVKAMEKAVRQVFGNNGVSFSQQTTQGITNPQVTTARSDPNCLGQVQTKEGLTITLIQGNIQDATTEVTVNTVFEDLVLSKGAVSNAIFSAAGPKLQDLVNAANTKGTIGEIVITDGCKLKSKKVFHAVTPHWDNGQGTAQKTLSGIFKDCLKMSEDSSLTSLSFPAIGTGNLGYPKDVVASSMLDEILAFSKKQPKHLKKVVIILYSGDAPTIQVFCDEFKNKFPSASGAPAASSSGPFTKVVSGTGMHETKMGNVAVQVVVGDITKETTDVIVNSSNEKFSLKTGVSKAILDAAGQTVEDECNNLGAQPNSGLIITQPGNLKCKKIIHVVGQTDPVKINKAVNTALQTCVKNSYASVSFPAIGTGQGNVQPKNVADAMLDAVISVLSTNASSALKTVRIIIFQPPMLKDFYSSMKQREATEPKEAGASWMGNLRSSFASLKSLFTSADKPSRQADFVIEALKVDPVCFHICGESNERVNLAKQWINDLIDKEHDCIPIADATILNLSDADHQHIVDIQRNMSVSITIESKNGQAVITIKGLTKEVLKASNEIHKMLTKTRDEEDLKKNLDLASAVADWQYQQGSGFLSFSPLNNYELEQALEKNLPSVKITINGQHHTVKLPNGPMVDNQGNALEIKRINKLKDEDIPDHWDTMPVKTTSHSVTIKAGTPEYTEVENLFKASCTQTIIKIERIQNPALWKSLLIKKMDMEVRNNHQNNEKRLFHGTSDDAIAHINDGNFNRSYVGKNAACFGNGTYFAVKASYSAQDTYSRPNQNGEKNMYLCRVLTGDCTLGKRDMVVPPAKSATSVQKYDSVVDNMANPNMYIVFHDTQAYPEYLITFK